MSKISESRIVLVGCGIMGGALLSAILRSGVNADNVMVISPRPEKVKQSHNNINCIDKFKDEVVAEFNPNVIIFAVKPDIIESILADYKQFSDKCLFITIVAGKKIPFYENILGKDAVIVRGMPNLPVMIGEGTTALYGNENVTPCHEEFILKLFQKTGLVVWMNRKRAVGFWDLPL